LKNVLQRFNKIFLFTVALPTLVAAVYFGLIASDVYISESRFVLRNPQRQTQTGLGALLQGTGFTRSQDDTYSVHDFALSRDALRQLEARLQVKKIFSHEGIDLVNRFPGTEWDESFEALYRYYKKHVTIEYDTVSSITTLYVRAYTAKDAQAINSALLEMSEKLVNNLNQRSRQDLIEVAQREVTIAEDRAKEAALALAGYRKDQSLFDPDRQSALQLQGVARLQDELISAQSQLAQVVQVSPDNPQIGALRKRIELLQAAIGVESSKVTGGKGSLTSKSANYDRLFLEKSFADRQLASAFAALESARSEAQRKQLYLERLVQPNEPDMALEPRRLRSILIVFALGIIVWGVATLVVASVREHSA
jgi:capsular polysaccharide transport system permease protein